MKKVTTIAKGQKAEDIIENVGCVTIALKGQEVLDWIRENESEAKCGMRFERNRAHRRGRSVED